jgi:hypothetical protein
MLKMTERALRKRDKGRDLGAELLASVRELEAGRAGHVHSVSSLGVTEAQTRAEFSSRGTRRGTRSGRQ